LKLSGDIRRDFEKVTAENLQLKDRILGYQECIKDLRTSLKRTQESREKQKNDFKSEIAEKDAIIQELKNMLAHTEALLDRDGSNTGLSTSQTPLNKKKIIPNSRKTTGKERGGQQGHLRHEMEVPNADFDDEIISHLLTDEYTCRTCGGADFIDTGDVTIKYEMDVQVKVIKRRHEYIIYRCLDCNCLVRVPIEQRLKQNAQYGSGVQAMALSLMNTVNAPINKVKMFLTGLTDGRIAVCEGYIAKLQKRAANSLDIFMRDLRIALIQLPLIYWDDTVIMINTERSCLRFYGDETIAYYTAHSKKDMEGLDEDRVLQALTGDTTVMHDHNKVNYNEKYHFKNIECNQHLQRDIQKSVDDSRHSELMELKDLISLTISARKKLIEAGIESFGEARILEFERKLENILVAAAEKNRLDYGIYSGKFEENLIKRIRKYHDNYFAWIYDFTLPTTDNLSERALRCVKSHMKISGQFLCENTARSFAKIKSYVETCRRNHINETVALVRLSEGHPFTVKEIFTASSP
jgi:hypothetical protein